MQRALWRRLGGCSAPYSIGARARTCSGIASGKDHRIRVELRPRISSTLSRPSPSMNVGRRPVSGLGQPLFYAGIRGASGDEKCRPSHSSPVFSVQYRRRRQTIEVARRPPVRQARQRTAVPWQCRVGAAVGCQLILVLNAGTDFKAAKALGLDC